MTKVRLILLLIIGLGLLLRTVNLAERPMYGDELTIVLDARSLWQTGRDQLGFETPLTFQMGAGRPAGYVYGSIPFVAVLGTNEYGVRGLSVVSGVILIGLMYWLGRLLVNDRVGLVAAGLMAVSPWGLSLSRVGFESNFGLMLMVLSVIGVIKAVTRPSWLLLVAVSSGIAIHTYPTFKLTWPLLLAGLIWYLGFKKWFTKKMIGWVVIAFAVFGVFAGLAAYQTLAAGSEERFASINIFSQPELQREVTEAVNKDRLDTQLPELVEQFFHNKVLVNANQFLSFYSQGLSVDFLWLNGDGNPRHNQAEWGGLYLFEMVTLLVGFGWLVMKQRRLVGLMGWWVLLGPLPAAIVGTPHALRASLMLPGLVLISAVGVWQVWISIGRWRWIAVGVVLVNLLFFGERLYFVAPAQSPGFWATQAKAASQEAIQKHSQYSAIFLADDIQDIEYAYPAYANVAAQMVIDNNLNKGLDNIFGLKRYDNIYLGRVTPEKLELATEMIPGKKLIIDKQGSREF